MKKLRLQSVEDVAPRKTTVLLYGPPASGKSTFSATWPGPYYLVPAISASETRAIQDMGFENNIVVFDDMKDMLEQTEALINAVRSGKLPDCHTIIFDNLTTAQMMVERELVTGDDKKKKYEEWGAFAQLWEQMLKGLHSLPVNIIWIAHSELKEVEFQPGVPPVVEGGPVLTGKSRRIITSFTDQLFFCECFRPSSALPAEFRVWLKNCRAYPSRVRGNKDAVAKLPSYLGGSDKKGVPVDPHYDQLAALLGWPSQVEVEEGASPKEERS
jgi:hypothetical protein